MDGFTPFIASPLAIKHAVPHRSRQDETSWMSFQTTKRSSISNEELQQEALRDEQVVVGPKRTTTCKYCSREFTSRNALFRHVRTDPVCCNKALVEATASGSVDEVNRAIFLNSPKRSVLLLVGYHYHCKQSNEIIGNTNTVSTTRSSSEQSANLLRKAFINALWELSGLNKTISTTSSTSLLLLEEEMVTFTQASAVRHRHPALAQELNCDASGDVFMVNYRRDQSDVEDVIRLANEMLLSSTDSEQQHSANNDEERMNVRVLASERISSEMNLHAESACTQRAYHYVLPISWLPDGDAAAEWWVRKVQGEGVIYSEVLDAKTTRFGVTRREHVQGSIGPPSLQKLKRILKSLAIVDESDFAYQQKAVGRFGSLGIKDKRCLHNFADPALEGLASPNNSPVWRSIDRARTAEVTQSSELLDILKALSEAADIGSKIVMKDHVFCVVELRGDSFLKQEARRIIGSVIAIVNGWLPEDFFSIATRPDVFIETPLAPEGFLYLAGARFDFNELAMKRALFRVKREDMQRQLEWTKDIQQKIMTRRAIKEEQVWLAELRDVVCPRIRNDLQRLADEEKQRKANLTLQNDICSSLVANGLAPKPEMFNDTLFLLQDIVGTGKWPSTSSARSRIIRRIENEESGSLVKKSGSFTVVNTDIFDSGDSNNNTPLGNSLFPDLVKSVFELERKICELNKLKRPPSSHCAVNRNAEFTPHVDSGRGAGQSLSMIVGLGDYARGSLFIEGKSHDIRYSPLEFDGWRQRHWTEPFDGERYSLVWFTPEKNTKNSNTSVAGMDDDAMAQDLVSNHATDVLPTYPPLMFRPRSTDVLVIKELLDVKKGSAYQWKDLANDALDFSPGSHAHILDIGAHIGVFVRYALGEGCQKITAYEPESENIRLLKQNTLQLNGNNSSQSSSVVIKEAAVAHGEVARTMELVRGQDKKDGTKNTWRHALSGYSHYKDKTKKDSTIVDVVPFFGSEGALEPGMTFVKLDCEGPEVDILLSAEASDAASWMDVTHLVFEWSFTKEKKIDRFHSASRNLESAGFVVMYEGKGSYWDIEPDMFWPFFTDHLIFATRARKSNPVK